VLRRHAGGDTSGGGVSGLHPFRGPRVAARLKIVAAAVASYSGLPEPMLARSGRLPTSGDYAYELKWGRPLAGAEHRPH
jgi:hypothetical protein